MQHLAKLRAEGDVCSEGHLSAPNILKRLDVVAVAVAEGGYPRDHLIGENPERPQVTRAVDAFAPQHLGGDVVGRAALRVGAVRDALREAEIAELRGWDGGHGWQGIVMRDGSVVGVVGVVERGGAFMVEVIWRMSGVVGDSGE